MGGGGVTYFWIAPKDLFNFFTVIHLTRFTCHIRNIVAFIVLLDSKLDAVNLCTYVLFFLIWVLHWCNHIKWHSRQLWILPTFSFDRLRVTALCRDRFNMHNRQIQLYYNPTHLSSDHHQHLFVYKYCQLLVLECILSKISLTTRTRFTISNKHKHVCACE